MVVIKNRVREIEDSISVSIGAGAELRGSPTSEHQSLSDNVVIDLSPVETNTCTHQTAVGRPAQIDVATEISDNGGLVHVRPFAIHVYMLR